MDVQEIGYGVFITIEGWGCNLVGCYGNALVPTPHLDIFASKAWVFDQYWMDRFSAKDLLHGVAPCEYESREWMIVTHTSEAREYFQCFGNVEVLELRGGEEYESGFQELILRGLSLWLERKHEFPYLWIHSRGLCGDWDAPYEFKQVMVDEGDPDPPVGCEPPDLILPPGYDPDERFRWACGAGGQAICIDRGIEELMELLNGLELADSCWVVLSGVRGYPLGEHGGIGFSGVGGYSEGLHCPLLIRLAQDEPLGGRIEGFMQPRGLSQWMRSLVRRIAGEDCCVDFEGYTSSMAYAMGAGELAIITSAWSAVFSVEMHSSGRVELKSLGVFCHPEDRWQQNEIQDRVPEVQQLFLRIAKSILVIEGVDTSGVEEEVSLERMIDELAGYGR
jgi:hypothetical protein